MSCPVKAEDPIVVPWNGSRSSSYLRGSRSRSLTNMDDILVNGGDGESVHEEHGRLNGHLVMRAIERLKQRLNEMKNRYEVAEQQKLHVDLTEEAEVPVEKSPGLIEYGLRWLPQSIRKYLPVSGNDSASYVEMLKAQFDTVESYGQWLAIANELDDIQGNNEWKKIDESPLYDYELIRTRLRQLQSARLNKDYSKLLFYVRTTWTRNVGNIGNLFLYKHSFTGTKNLIEDYINECNLALEALASPECTLDEKYLLNMLVQTRKAFGRTALVLSGGGCFGLYHIGVLKALIDLNLLPRVISGSSAGAIFASILCVHTNDEIQDLLLSLADKTFNIFDDEENKEGLLLCLSRFLKHGTWFDNNFLRQTMQQFLGELTFKEAYNRTGRIINVTVSPASIHEQPHLLNFLTAPNVLIWSAVCASCALPGVFASTTIYQKNPRTGIPEPWSNFVKFVDGSVDNDLPINRLSEMLDVDHIIACQVNPHVTPFLKISTLAGGVQKNRFPKDRSGNLMYDPVANDAQADWLTMGKKFLHAAYNFTSTEAMHYLDVASQVGFLKNVATKLKSVLAQKYFGDITIVPDIPLTELNKLLVNPTYDYISYCILRGAQATWPKVSIIRNHCSLEISLDQTISKVRAAMIARKTLRYSANMPPALVISPMNTDTELDSEAPLDDALSAGKVGESIGLFQADSKVHLDAVWHHRRSARTLPRKMSLNIIPTAPGSEDIPGRSLAVPQASSSGVMSQGFSDSPDGRNHQRHRSESASVAVLLRGLPAKHSSTRPSLEDMRHHFSAGHEMDITSDNPRMIVTSADTQGKSRGNSPHGLITSSGMKSSVSTTSLRSLEEVLPGSSGGNRTPSAKARRQTLQSSFNMDGGTFSQVRPGSMEQQYEIPAWSFSASPMVVKQEPNAQSSSGMMNQTSEHPFRSASLTELRALPNTDNSLEEEDEEDVSTEEPFRDTTATTTTTSLRVVRKNSSLSTLRFTSSGDYSRQRSMTISSTRRRVDSDGSDSDAQL